MMSCGVLSVNFNDIFHLFLLFLLLTLNKYMLAGKFCEKTIEQKGVCPFLTKTCCHVPEKLSGKLVLLNENNKAKNQNCLNLDLRLFFSKFNNFHPQNSILRQHIDYESKLRLTKPTQQHDPQPTCIDFFCYFSVITPIEQHSVSNEVSHQALSKKIFPI